MIRTTVKTFAVLCLIGLIGFAAFVRMAPIDPARWHLPTYPSGVGHVERMAGHVWRGPQDGDGGAQLAKLDQIIRQTPRTQVVAGTVEEGMITYVTRSKWWGFPDFTTVLRDVRLIQDGNSMIEISSRARFGTSDLGVNQRRIREWLIAFEAGG